MVFSRQIGAGVFSSKPTFGVCALPKTRPKVWELSWKNANPNSRAAEATDSYGVQSGDSPDCL